MNYRMLKLGGGKTMGVSNYKLEVTLEQITPYVNDIDVTLDKGKDILRPTEFKPRFDKFLCRKYGEKGLEGLFLLKEKGEHWDSLNYGILIQTNEEYQKRGTRDTFKTSGKPYYVRENLIKLKVTFFSLHSKLISIIQENLAEFLATTNFGKRKNKCYGSFYIEKGDSCYKSLDNIEILKKYDFFQSDNKNINYVPLEGNIDSYFDKLELSVEKKDKMKKPFVIFRMKEKRKESLGLMKILKESKDKYRLYFIPNDALIEKAIKAKQIDEIEKGSFKNKFPDKEGRFFYFDYNKFGEYLREKENELCKR